MPMNLADYHPQWRDISRQIRFQADDRCEWPGCGVANGAIGYRFPDGRFEEVQGCGDEQVEDGGRGIRIVLTVAHMDHDCANNDPANLRALCQMHHLRHDAKQHAASAATTRRLRAVDRGQTTMEL